MRVAAANQLTTPQIKPTLEYRFGGLGVLILIRDSQKTKDSKRPFAGRAPDYCANCLKIGQKVEVHPHKNECIICLHNAGFPNVRAANNASERAALRDRLEEAIASSTALLREVADFYQYCGSTKAVKAMSLERLVSFIGGEIPFLTNYSSKIRSGCIAPSSTELDLEREQCDSAMHPAYSDKIHHAALSLTGRSARHFGSYHVTFKSGHIAGRASVLEENTILFVERHKCKGGNIPLGFRASWKNRSKLALAKLYKKLRPGMALADFKDILLADNDHWREADFVEVNIYGPIHADSVEDVIGPPPGKSDKFQWEFVNSTLNTKGVSLRTER